MQYTNGQAVNNNTNPFVQVNGNAIRFIQKPTKIREYAQITKHLMQLGFTGVEIANGFTSNDVPSPTGKTMTPDLVFSYNVYEKRRNREYQKRYIERKKKHLVTETKPKAQTNAISTQAVLETVRFSLTSDKFSDKQAREVALAFIDSMGGANANRN